MATPRKKRLRWKSAILNFFKKRLIHYKKSRQSYRFAFSKLGWIVGTMVCAYIISKYVYPLIPWETARITLSTLLIITTIAIFCITARQIYRFKPVERDRMLFARSVGMVFYSGIAIFLLLTFVNTTAYLLGIESKNIYSDTADDASGTPIHWNIISQFADPGNLPNANGFFGSAIALLCAFAGILGLSGLLVSSLVSLVARRTDKWRKGLLYYTYGFENYVVVIGCNKQAPTIIRNALEREDVDYVLVQTRKDVERERSLLELKLESDYEKRVVFYFGERTLYEDIKTLQLEKAKEVYILGEDMELDSEQDHDSFNMTCLQMVSRYCKDLKNSKKEENTMPKLKCHVNLEFQSTYTIFKYTHIFKSLNENIEFIPFNIHEIWAKKVLVDNYAIIPGEKRDEQKVQRYLPLDTYMSDQGTLTSGIGPDTRKAVHLFVIGMNQMGSALAMQAALLTHLPNFHTKGLRTTITFIDPHAKEEGEYLKGRFAAMFELCIHRTIVCNEETDAKELLKASNINGKWNDPMPNGRFAHLGQNFMDLQWEFIEGNVASPEIQHYMEFCCQNKQRTVTIAVCHNDPQQSIATALCLPENVLKRALQVLVYQKNTFDLITKAATGEREWKRYEKLRPFGMNEDCYKGDMMENIMAKLCLRLYERHSIRNIPDLERFIKYTERRWSEEGIVNKLANINLVDSFGVKLRSAGLTPQSDMDERNKVARNQRLCKLLAMAEHQRWVTEKLTMGFRPLNAQELAFFLDGITPEQKKAQKELLKTKRRAHLNICSIEMLKQLDDTTENDKRIIRNVVMMRFQALKSKILCHNAMRLLQEAGDDPGKITDPRIRICAIFFKEMVFLPKHTIIKAPYNQKKSLYQVMQPMWIGRTAVTQKLWVMLMGEGSNPSSRRGENYPVESVSKNDVENFITILNDMTGLSFRLPSKDEWLSAALGDWTISNFSKKCNIEDYAWFNQDWKEADSASHHSTARIHPVTKKRPNAFGLYDMLGNVWEWTNEAHGPSTFCFCGGSWRFSETECDLSNKEESWCSYWTPDFASSDLGFRLLLPMPFDITLTDSSDNNEQEKMMKDILTKMCKVEEGTFHIGRTQNQEIHDGTYLKDGTPSTVVTNSDRHLCLLSMSGFMMGDAPVTQRQWVAFMGEEANRSSHKGDDYPVENVSYLDAVEFIRTVNEYVKSHYNYQAELFSLPTEAQWEYAAKMGNERPAAPIHPEDYHVYSLGGNPDIEAWHNGITKRTNKVRTKQCNKLGIYDLCGNVCEWCQDWYQADYFKNLSIQSQGQNPPRDPQGPSHGCTRVMRGGSWKFTAGECRVTRTSYWTEDYRSDDLGFRLVVNDVDGYLSVKKANLERFQRKG